MLSKLSECSFSYWSILHPIHCIILLFLFSYFFSLSETQKKRKIVQHNTVIINLFQLTMEIHWKMFHSFSGFPKWKTQLEMSCQTFSTFWRNYFGQKFSIYIYSYTVVIIAESFHWTFIIWNGSNNNSKYIVRRIEYNIVINHNIKNPQKAMFFCSGNKQKQKEKIKKYHCYFRIGLFEWWKARIVDSILIVQMLFKNKTKICEKRSKKNGEKSPEKNFEMQIHFPNKQYCNKLMVKEKRGLEIQ